MKKNKGRILCVDDDKDNCEMMTALLDFSGYEACYALTVAEGIQLAKKEHFDLILLDWFYDDGTGVEMCQIIRSFDTQTPILFYSGISDADEIKRAMSVGAQGFLIKPVGMEELLQSISGMVNKNSGATPHIN